MSKCEKAEEFVTPTTIGDGGGHHHPYLHNTQQQQQVQYRRKQQHQQQQQSQQHYQHDRYRKQMHSAGEKEDNKVPAKYLNDEKAEGRGRGAGHEAPPSHSIHQYPRNAVNTFKNNNHPNNAFASNNNLNNNKNYYRQGRKQTLLNRDARRCYGSNGHNEEVGDQELHHEDQDLREENDLQEGVEELDVYDAEDDEEEIAPPTGALEHEIEVQMDEGVQGRRIKVEPGVVASKYHPPPPLANTMCYGYRNTSASEPNLKYSIGSTTITRRKRPNCGPVPTASVSVTPVNNVPPGERFKMAMKPAQHYHRSSSMAPAPPSSMGRNYSRGSSSYAMTNNRHTNAVAGGGGGGGPNLNHSTMAGGFSGGGGGVGGGGIPNTSSLCGEIFVTGNARKWTFMCTYCQQSTRDIGEFVLHVKQNHLGEFNGQNHYEDEIAMRDSMDEESANDDDQLIITPSYGNNSQQIMQDNEECQDEDYLDYSNYLDVHVYTDQDQQYHHRVGDQNDVRNSQKRQTVHQETRSENRLARGQTRSGYAATNQGRISGQHGEKFPDYSTHSQQQQYHHQSQQPQSMTAQHNQGRADEDEDMEYVGGEAPVLRKRYKRSMGGTENTYSGQSSNIMTLSGGQQTSRAHLHQATLSTGGSAASGGISSALKDNVKELIQRRTWNNETEIVPTTTPTAMVNSTTVPSEMQELADNNNTHSIFNGIDSSGQRKKRKQIRGTAYCSLCDKTFQYYSLYRNHMIKHSNHTPYTCQLCQKGFKSKQAIRYHMSTHSRDKQIKCRLCTLTFSTMNQLLGHVLTHESDRIFPCAVCGKILTSAQKRKDHAATHIDERPYRCSYCSKTFRQRHHLSLHLTLHRQYRCQNCHSEFSSEEPVRRPYICGKCSLESARARYTAGNDDQQVTEVNESMSGNDDGSALDKSDSINATNCSNTSGGGEGVAPSSPSEINPLDLNEKHQIEDDLRKDAAEEEKELQQAERPSTMRATRGRGRPRRRPQHLTEFVELDDLNSAENSIVGDQEAEATYEDTVEDADIGRGDDHGPEGGDNDEEVEGGEDDLEEKSGEKRKRRRLACNYCNRTFEHNNDLKIHLKQKHLKVEPE